MDFFRHAESIKSKRIRALCVTLQRVVIAWKKNRAIFLSLSLFFFAWWESEQSSTIPVVKKDGVVWRFEPWSFSVFQSDKDISLKDKDNVNWKQLPIFRTTGLSTESLRGKVAQAFFKAIALYHMLRLALMFCNDCNEELELDGACALSKSLLTASNHHWHGTFTDYIFFVDGLNSTKTKAKTTETLTATTEIFFLSFFNRNNNGNNKNISSFFFYFADLFFLSHFRKLSVFR